MLGVRKIDPNLDTGKILNGIQNAVYCYLKPYGFTKHGRTLHRFVSGDISQAITFQLGQAYRGETHLLFINTGIRVPESMNRTFDSEEHPKKYYQAYECNIRSRFGIIEGNMEACYDLRNSADIIISDILRQIETFLIPFFEALDSREAILAHRRDYPAFDILNDHLILLEEAMIYGHLGQYARAAETLREYYHLFGSGALAQKDPKAIENHLRYLDTLAERLGIEIK